MPQLHPKNPNAWTFRWIVGLLITTSYSFGCYMLAPTYDLSAILSFIFLSFDRALLYSLPFVVSFLLPPIHSPMITGMMTPLATGYFQYDEILEQSYDEIQQELQTGIQRNFLLCLQPHGIIPFAGFCVNIMAPPYFKRTKTAVASILLWCPILKHLLGINGVISASKSSLSKHLKTPGIDGCVQIYVGGMAEVFKSSPLEERLFLSKRRGFIKLALRENVDIVPGYLFGNTSILTGYKNDFQARLSRKMGMTATYYFGKWLMPIPRDENLLYVRGKPMGLPHIPNPTQRDVDYWHVQYCLEVTRLFETYKDKLPNYKNKTLYID